MTRFEALKLVLEKISPKDLALFTTGFTCREASLASDREGNFYMLGSMGHLLPFGLGLALAKPERKILIFDGDGSCLMNLAALAMVAELAPKNLFHIVIDNEVYGSTGNQPTASRRVPLEKVAQAAGYSQVRKADNAPDLKRFLLELLNIDGPHFLLVKVDQTAQKAPRINLTPEQILARFKKVLNS